MTSSIPKPGRNLLFSRRWRCPAAAVLMLLAACGGESETPPAQQAPIAEPIAPAPVTTPAAIPTPEAARAPAQPEAAPLPAPEAAPIIPAPAPPAPDVTPTPAPAPVPEPVAPAPVAPAEPAPGAPAPAAAAAPAAATPTPATPPTPPAEAAAPGLGPPELLARIAAADPVAGQSVGDRCTVCHTTGMGQPAMIGPNLYGIVGARVGRTQGFSYSVAIQALRAEGAIWTFDRLDAFLTSPATNIPGTRMGFAGIDNEAERANLLAFLRTLAANPVPLAPTAGTAEATRNGLLPLVFTQEQVDIGRDYYVRECTRCHGINLAGTWFGDEWGDAFPLAGTRFQAKWFDKTVAAFFERMQTVRIPNGYPFDHTNLWPERYADLLAYIMQRNGFSPGLAPLPIDPAVLATMGFWQ